MVDRKGNLVGAGPKSELKFGPDIATSSNTILFLHDSMRVAETLGLTLNFVTSHVRILSAASAQLLAQDRASEIRVTDNVMVKWK